VAIKDEVKYSLNSAQLGSLLSFNPGGVGPFGERQERGSWVGKEKKKKSKCVFEHTRTASVSSVCVLVLIFLERSKTIT
jgi:hypothetical protein